MRMTHTRLIFGLLAGATVACSVGNVVLEDTRTTGNAWIDLSLEITGPEATRGHVKACLAEARKAGIRLHQGAANQAALTLSNDGNSVNAAGQAFVIEQKLYPALCRIALAKAVSLDQRVQSGKTDPQGNCRPLGTVAGTDQGEMNGPPGSAEASIVAAKFAALQLGANYLALEPTESFYSEGEWGDTIARTKGRAFLCSDGGAPVITS